MAGRSIRLQFVVMDVAGEDQTPYLVTMEMEDYLDGGTRKAIREAIRGYERGLTLADRRDIAGVMKGMDRFTISVLPLSEGQLNAWTASKGDVWYV